MDTIWSAIKNLTQFNDDTWLLFSNVLTSFPLAKGDCLLQPGQVCKHIYFLQTGLLRSFYTKEGDEHSIAFALDHSFLTDLKSLRSGCPTELTIQAIEPSTVFSVAKSDLIALYQQSHQIEAFGRRLLETLLEEQEEYLSWFKLYSAKERYNLVAQKYPALLQRIPLSHLASFLGIRRETLSRIRKLK